MIRRSIVVPVAAGLFLAGGLVGAVVAPGGETQPSGSEPTAPIEQHAPDGDDMPAGGEDSSPLDVEEVAVEYATASQRWLYLTDAQIDSAVRLIATPAAADRLSEETVAELSVARDALAHSAGPVWWFVRPLAVRTVRVGDERAEVSVWVVTVLSAADVAVPQADWVTLDLELVLTGDRWLLESITDTPGPTPMSGVRDDPWQPEPFDDALAGFERIGADR